MAALFVRLTLVAIALLLVNQFHIVNSQRTKERMYQELSGASCFKRLNGTHETGCSSKFGGSTGVLHLIRTADDFAFLHDSPPAPPYAVIVPAALFTRALIMPLQRSPHISGIILVRDNPADPSAEPADSTATSPPFYTQELACPNPSSSFPINGDSCPADGAAPWNPHGTGMLRESFPFPIIYLADEQQAERVRQCHDRFNAHDRAAQHRRSLCSIEIQQFMSAAGSAEICMRRANSGWNMQPTRYCDPLSGDNVYATLFERSVVSGARTTEADGEDLDELVEGGEEEAASVETTTTTTTTESTPAQREQFILVSAPIDSASMFDALSPGAQESLALVTLLSVAHTLSALLTPQRKHAAQPNVLFAFFNGEAYDYIGSQSVAWSMRHGTYPPRFHRRAQIAAADVLLHVDLGDLSAPADQLGAFQITEFPAAAALISALDKYNRAFSLNINTTSHLTPTLPPSSAHSFLREFNRTWPAVVLRSATANPHLHSVFDDAASLRFRYANTSADFQSLEPLSLAPAPFDATSAQLQVRNTSSLLAFALYELVTGMVYNGRLGASAVLADELLHCYVHASACRLLRAAVSPKVRGPIGRDEAPQRYVSVQQSYLSETVAMTADLLVLLVSRRLENVSSAAQCKAAAPDATWIRGDDGSGECRVSRANKTLAYSPAYLLQEHGWPTGPYSTWAESTWSEMGARLFLRPSATREALTLALGFVAVSVSMLLVFLVSSRADELFGGAEEQRRMMAATMIAHGVQQQQQPEQTGAEQQQAAAAPVQC